MGYNSDYIQELQIKIQELEAKNKLLQWENDNLRELIIRKEK